jgi:hypothetical protein
MKKSNVNGKWVKTCRVCSLYLTNPELWIEIHNRVNIKGESRRSVVNWLNSVKLPELRLEYPKDHPKHIESAFNEQIFQRHFSGVIGDGTTGHDQDFYSIKRSLDARILKKSSDDQLQDNKDRMLTPEDFMAAENYMLELNKELKDYSSLTQMVDNLETILASYDHKLKERINKDERIPLGEIEQYQKQVSALFKLTQDLTLMRNKTTIAGEAVQLAIKMSTSLFLEYLLVILEEAKDTLKVEMPNSNLPKEIMDNVINKQRSAMKSIIEDILKKVTTEFKIK